MEEDLFRRKKSSYDTTFFQNRKRRKPATFTTFCLFLSFARLDASFSEEFFEISFFKNNSRLSRKVPDMVFFGEFQRKGLLPYLDITSIIIGGKHWDYTKQESGTAFLKRAFTMYLQTWHHHSTLFCYRRI